MTKQEEIRKAIKTCIAIEQSAGDFDGNRLTQKILEVEDILGVVLKADRDKLPPTLRLSEGKSMSVRDVVEITQKEMIDFGYVAVEPLI